MIRASIGTIISFPYNGKTYKRELVGFCEIGYDDEDINAMAGDMVVNNALAHIHTKENGIIIDNIENCGVNY